MAENQQELQLIITAQNKAMGELAKLSKDVQVLSGKTVDANKSSKDYTAVLAKLTGAYLIVKKGILDSITAWVEQEKVLKQTEAVLQSTKHAIGMTADEVGNLANEMQMYTAYADEVVQSGENLLLTFTNIGKEIFPLATETMLDMSTALGQDVKNSAIQLGKALQDPIRGVTALRKVGVNFNDTQMETIKTLVASGKAMEAQKLILKELSTEFGGSARKELETFGGKMKWMKNQVGEVQEALGKGLTQGIMDAVVGFNKSGDQLVNDMNNVKIQVQMWSRAIVNGFAWVIRTIWNAMQNGIEAIKGLFLGAGAMLVDLWENAVEAIKSGDFEFQARNMDAVWSETMQNMQVNTDDMKNAFENAYVGVNSTFDETGNNATALAKDFGSLGDAGGASAKEISDKMKEAAKKIRDLKSEMKKAVAEAKNDIKKFKEEFAKEEKTQEATLGVNIAKAFIEKQTEKADIEKQLNEETTADNKTSLEAKLAEINAFFQKHTQDQTLYAEQIKREQEKAAMDSIELLKAEFAEEKAVRLVEYEEKMKELKDHLKQVKKEYKERLKELKKEIKEDGLDSIKVNVSFSESKSSSNKKKRATGGSVMSGHEYIVGEEGMEVFRPSVSGSIEKPSSFGGSKPLNVTFDFSGAVIGDKASLIREIENVLNRKQEVIRLGMR